MKTSKSISHVKVSTIISSIDKLKFSDEVEMRLSQVPGSRKYIKFIGLSRLMNLLDVINDIHKGNFEGMIDPVGELLDNIGIEFNFISNQLPGISVLHEIDLLLMNSKIAKAVKEIKVTMKLDQKMLLAAVASSMRETEIQIMVAIKQSGGDPNRYLKDTYGQQEKQQTA